MEVLRPGVKKICKPWRKLGKCEVNPRGVADLEYEVIGFKWQQESLITNGNPNLLGNCGDFDTELLTDVRKM